jgi:hypothetical protein
MIVVLPAGFAALLGVFDRDELVHLPAAAILSSYDWSEKPGQVTSVLMYASSIPITRRACAATLALINLKVM